MSAVTGRLIQYGKSIAAAVNRANATSVYLVSSNFNLNRHFSSAPEVPGDASREPFIPAYQQV